MRYRWLLMIFLLSILLCGTGCHREQLVYHYFAQLPDRGWDSDEELFFSTSDLQPQQSYDVELILRLDRRIKYRSIPLGITFETPTRHISTRVAVFPIEHRWLRSGGFTIDEQRMTLESGAKFPIHGVYTYSIRHLSTDPLLYGVVEVGIAIRPHAIK